jgi:hypothetical protein
MSSWHAASATGKFYVHFSFTNKFETPTRKEMKRTELALFYQ